MSDANDGCAGIEPMKAKATAWFIGALVISASLAFGLSRIDRYMYDSKAPYLDNAKSAENRLAATSIKSESIDARQKASELQHQAEE